MSDKQKGLIDAVGLVLPNCEHRFCLMYLYSNFKQSHKGLALKLLVWKASKATRIADFEIAMNDLRARDKDAFTWLAKRPAAHWAKSFFRTECKSDINTNNLSESFNALILQARRKFIIDMLENIRLILMKRVYVKRDQAKNWTGDLCPNVQAVLDLHKEKSTGFVPRWNGHEQFEIDGGKGKYTLHLGEKTCSCRKWQLTGIPCPHAICGMFFMGYKPEDFVQDCYKVSTFLKTYSHLMVPLHGPEEWPVSSRPMLMPPLVERLPGRPKTGGRIKTADELEEIKGKNKKYVRKKKPVVVTNLGAASGKLGRQGLVMTCRLCHKSGHNLRSCDLNPKNQPQEQGLDVPPPTDDSNSKAKGKGKVSEVAQIGVVDNSKAKGKRKVSEVAQIGVVDDHVDEGYIQPTQQSETSTSKRMKLPVRRRMQAPTGPAITRSKATKAKFKEAPVIKGKEGLSKTEAAKAPTEPAITRSKATIQSSKANKTGKPPAKGKEGLSKTKPAKAPTGTKNDAKKGFKAQTISSTAKARTSYQRSMSKL